MDELGKISERAWYLSLQWHKRLCESKLLNKRAAASPKYLGITQNRHGHAPSGCEWYKNCDGCILLSTHFYVIPNTYTLSTVLAILLCPFSISVLEDCKLQKTFQMTLKWELRLDKAKYGCALYKFDNVNSVNFNLEHRTSCGTNIAGNVTSSGTCIPSPGPSTNGPGNQANPTFVTSPESSNPNSVFIHLATAPESSDPDSGSTHFTRYPNCNSR